LSLREKLNERPALVTSAAVLTLALALGAIWYRYAGPVDRPSPDAYYFDLNTERVIVSEVANPPIETDSGAHDGQPAGVEVAIYSCGQCAERYTGMTARQVKQAGARIAYLLKRPPEHSENALTVLWVREVGDADWTKVTKSSQPRPVPHPIMRIEPCEEGSPPTRCFPGE
jgi:hypothetical protein